MTICIAALCDEGRAVIAAADRMVTVGGLNIEIQRAKSKVSALGKHHLLMAAGDGLVGEDVVRAMRNQVRQHDTADVEALAQALLETYCALRLQRIEQQMLRPIGYTLQTFQESGTKQLGNVAMQAIQSMGQFDFNSEVLLAGFADGMARVAHVQNPGVLRWTDGMDFYAVGSGAIHALLSLLQAGSASTQSMGRVLFHVYVAKRSAELAPGVGDETDIYVATHEQAVKLQSEVVTELGRMYEEFLSLRRKEQDHGKLEEVLKDVLGQQEKA